jgi:hypothetical protein
VKNFANPLILKNIVSQFFFQTRNFWQKILYHIIFHKISKTHHLKKMTTSKGFWRIDLIFNIYVIWNFNPCSPYFLAKRFSTITINGAFTLDVKVNDVRELNIKVLNIKCEHTLSCHSIYHLSFHWNLMVLVKMLSITICDNLVG